MRPMSRCGLIGLPALLKQRRKRPPDMAASKRVSLPMRPVSVAWFCNPAGPGARAGFF